MKNCRYWFSSKTKETSQHLVQCLPLLYKQGPDATERAKEKVDHGITPTPPFQPRGLKALLVLEIDMEWKDMDLERKHHNTNISNCSQ